MAADLILKNANVVTMDAGLPIAHLVAVAGDEVLMVGGGEDLESVTGPSSRIIDCEGKTVLPGFNDAHCHIFALVRNLLSVDVSPTSVRSIADIKALLHQRALSTRPGNWILGDGLNEFYLTEKRLPTRQELDDVTPLHPVVLTHRTLHACVLNSRALALAHITWKTPAPPGGLIDRDVHTGEPNGVLFEMVGYIRDQVIPPLSGEEIEKGMALANKQYLACGITSLQDATAGNDYRRWGEFRRLKESGKLTSRLYLMVGAESWTQFLEAGLRTGAGDSDLRLGAVKVMLSEATGRLLPDHTELECLALEADCAGFQLAMHAIQASEVEAAVTALERLGQKAVADRRHRIEHCSQCPARLMLRLRKLKPLVVSQPPFVYYSGERYLATMPPRELKWLYRFRSLIDAGVVVAGSSDSPVVPNSPLAGIQAAVTRQAETGQAVLAEEAITVREALALYTTNAAYASLEEGIKGSIEPGKLADLVVLSDDPTRAPPDRIKDIKIEMTIVGGKVVWEA